MQKQTSCHGIFFCVADIQKPHQLSRNEEHTGQSTKCLLMRVKVLMCLQGVLTKLCAHVSVICHKQLCTSSANICSFSAQDSMSDRVSRTSAASSLMRRAPSLIVCKALSRSFLSWRSRVVRLGRPSSSGVWKLEEEQETNPASRSKTISK